MYNDSKTTNMQNIIFHHYQTANDMCLQVCYGIILSKYGNMGCSRTQTV